jgi:hypothetical protein
MLYDALLPPAQYPGNLTHKIGYSVAYKTEQSISMVPPIFVVIGGVTYEIVGVLCPLQTNLPRPTTSETAKNQVNIFLAIFGALAVQNQSVAEDWMEIDAFPKTVKHNRCSNSYFTI